MTYLSCVRQRLDHDEANLEEELSGNGFFDVSSSHLGIMRIVRKVHPTRQLDSQFYHIEQRLVLVKPEIMVGHSLELK